MEVPLNLHLGSLLKNIWPFLIIHIKLSVFNCWFAPDVTAAMLVYRTIAKKVFWEFDSIIMQNLSEILLLFCTPTCQPHHVSATQEFTIICYFHITRNAFCLPHKLSLNYCQLFPTAFEDNSLCKICGERKMRCVLSRVNLFTLEVI